MNLPNGLTLIRIFLVPLLVAVLLTKYNVLIAALIFLAASLTDLLDGYYARKRGQVTTLGILLDPVADKLLLWCCLPCGLLSTISGDFGPRSTIGSKHENAVA